MNLFFFTIFKISRILCIALMIVSFSRQPVIAQQNDSALIKGLIKSIAEDQVKTDGEFYAGMYPSFRETAGSPHNYQPDNNIFFTAVATFALKNMLPGLTGENKAIAANLINNSIKTYPYYQNKNGEPYYGFWPTYGVIMPNSYYFKYLKGVFGQGEDADDSVMILMTMDNNDSICKVLKNRMILASNLEKKKRKIISTYKKYRNIPAYSTYLGLRMTPDFDFAVHCNILYFMLDKKLPMVKQDSATIYLLQQMIKNREYKKTPVFLSPYYVHSSILLYHVARLMGKFSIPELELYKPQLITDIHEALTKSSNIMDKIILSTSLLRLGADAPALPIHNLNDFENSNQNRFVFFQARAAFSYPVLLKQIFLHWSYINYYFYCPAYNKVLLLEYLIEKKKNN